MNMDKEDLSAPNFHQLGCDGGNGNVLGVEPYMVVQDYASGDAFFRKLNSYLLAARERNWLNERSIVMFPEYTGTWLVIANESEKIFRVDSLSTAERLMILHHPIKFLANFLGATEKGRVEAAFFRMKEKQMAAIYHQVFSRLAREHGVLIVAGSIVMPAPEISSRGLIPLKGPLHNLGIVYQPDGTPVQQPVVKAFPTSRELPFIAPRVGMDIPVFDTPLGRLGVLICADSWYPQAYGPLKEHGIDLLVVPSYDVSGMKIWHQPWKGYDGWPAPGDVDRDDIGKITEARAWKKYALAGRIRSSGAMHGMNIFLRGKLWDQDLGGLPATLVKDGDVFEEEQTDKAAILSLWL